MAESEGFEPPLGFPKPDFESGAIDHSANSPEPLIIADRAAAPGWGATGKKMEAASGPHCSAIDDLSRYFLAAGAAGFAAAGGGAGVAAAICAAGTCLPFAFMSAK